MVCADSMNLVMVSGVRGYIDANATNAAGYLQSQRGGGLIEGFLGAGVGVGMGSQAKGHGGLSEVREAAGGR